jgi:hypothetical protein
MLAYHLNTVPEIGVYFYKLEMAILILGRHLITTYSQTIMYICVVCMPVFLHVTLKSLCFKILPTSENRNPKSKPFDEPHTYWFWYSNGLVFKWLVL